MELLRQSGTSLRIQAIAGAIGNNHCRVTQGRRRQKYLAARACRHERHIDQHHHRRLRGAAPRVRVDGNLYRIPLQHFARAAGIAVARGDFERGAAPLLGAFDAALCAKK